MTTQLVIYDATLTAATATTEATLFRLDVIADALDVAKDALSYLEQIKDDAGQLRQTAAGIETLLKLVGKVTALKFLTNPLAQLVGQIEARAAAVETKATQLDRDWNDLKQLQTQIDTQSNIVSAQQLALKAVLADMVSVRSSLRDAMEASLMPQLPAYALAAVDNANLTLQPADLPSVQAALDAIAAADDAVEAAFAPVLGPARSIASIMGTVNALVSNLAVLRGPMAVVDKALAPISWALEASDFVFNIVVNPVLNPILDALGFQKLVKDVLKRLGLPDLAVFDNFESMLMDLEDALALDGGPLRDLWDAIDALVDPILNPNGFVTLLQATGSDDGELILGDDLPPGSDPNPGTTLSARAGDDLVAGGLGNDLLFGGHGDDVLVGGQGDDTMDGGPGQDVAVLFGNFADFAFTFDEATATLTTRHVRVGPGQQAQGTDVILNVTDVVFNDQRVALGDFGNIRQSGSVAGGPHVTLTGDQDGPQRDFLLGGPGRDLFYGRDLDDYLSGGESEDSLFGGRGDDWIRGGPGIDFIDGGPGIDTAVYELGDGAPPGFNHVDLRNDPTRRPFVPNEAVQNIENLTGGAARDYFWGSDISNRLEGRGGDDVLVGFAGRDTLLGGEGNDTLVGGDGHDVMDGGAGTDVFVGGRGNDTLVGAGHLYYGTTAESPLDLLQLGFLSSELATLLPARVTVNLPAGSVRKFDATGRSVGTDTLSPDLTRITGTGGNDVFFGGAGTEWFHGGEGDDRFSSQDSQPGAPSADRFWGGAGNDHFNPGTGEATIWGGSGNDTLIADDISFVHAEGGSGHDVLDFSRLGYEVFYSSGNTSYAGVVGRRLEVDAEDLGIVWQFSAFGFEEIIGSRHNDRLTAGTTTSHILSGNAGADTLQARSSTPGLYGDTLYGGAGDDELHTSRGNDVIYGGTGDDLVLSIFQTGGDDTLYGGDGNDRFVIWSSGRSLIFGGDGFDELDLTNWTGFYDYAFGTVLEGPATRPFILDSIESIRGSAAGEILAALGTIRQLIGGGGNDALVGSAFDDILYGNAGNDTLNGHGGNDILYGGTGFNQFIGGAGTDVVSFTPEMEGDRWDGSRFWEPIRIEGTVDIDLMRREGTFATDYLAPGQVYRNLFTGIENIIGASGNDRIGGDHVDNVISGGAGADLLRGRGGNDTLLGGDGNDTLEGDSDWPADLVLGYVNQAVLSPTEHFWLSGLARIGGPTGLTLEMVVQHDLGRIASGNVALVSYAVPAQFNELVLEALPGANLRLIYRGTFVTTGVATSRVLDGEMHRVSLTVDHAAAQVRLYLDGVLADTMTNAAFATAARGGGFLSFGQEQDAVGGGFDAGQAFAGGYGDLRLFDRVRTAAEIAAHWQTQLAAPALEPGLLANWQGSLADGRFNDVAGGLAPLTSTVGSASNAFRMVGAAGDDLMAGEAGDDLLSGGGGDDTLEGGDGNDTLIGGQGNDELFGGAGFDRALFQGAADTTVDLRITAAQDTGHGLDLLRGIEAVTTGDGNDRVTGSGIANEIRTGAGNDAAYGGNGDDTLFGEGGDDLLRGGNGADMLLGGAGDDTLRGDGGADTLVGEGGNDELRGGPDADWFVFLPDMGHDRVVDFEPGVDSIVLSRALWSSTLTAEQVMTAFARIEDGNVVFEFGPDAVLTLSGITSLEGLAQDLILT
ncbi:MAG: hypothetical protein KF887_01020 [Paracoccaceae bacterium]|nr:MAG: hypothetical protein KF887_01020 [Paracoccaceae bacterium]